MISTNSGADFVYDQYVDDQSWWGIFALKGYQAYGNYTWIQQVQGLAGISWQSWDTACGGGFRWITCSSHHPTASGALSRCDADESTTTWLNYRRLHGKEYDYQHVKPRIYLLVGTGEADMCFICFDTGCSWQFSRDCIASQESQTTLIMRSLLSIGGWDGPLSRRRARFGTRSRWMDAVRIGRGFSRGPTTQE